MAMARCLDIVFGATPSPPTPPAIKEPIDVRRKRSKYHTTRARRRSLRRSSERCTAHDISRKTRKTNSLTHFFRSPFRSLAFTLSGVAVRTNPARAIKIKFTHTLPRTNKKKIHRESKRRNRRKIHDRARSSTHFFFLATTDRFCSFSHCLACRVTELLLSGFRGARGGATQSSTHTLRTPHVIPSRRRRQSSS